MIKPNIIIGLAIILALLGLGFLLVREDRPAVKAPEKIGDRLLTEFNTSTVNSIEIKKGDVTVKLDKKDKQWFLTSHKNRLAKTDRVEQLLTEAATAAIEGTRSGNAKTFALDDEGRTNLTFQREAGKTELLVGKSPDFSKAFVRTDKDGPIYEINKGLDNSAGVRTGEGDKRMLDPTYFYDLKIVGIPADDIIDIAIKKGHEVTRLQRVIPGKGPLAPKQEIPKDGPKPEWWITEPEGAAADEGVVGRITSAVADLNAESYAENLSAKDAGLDQPTAKVKLVTKDGTETTFSFGKVEGDKVYLSVSGKNDIFKGYKYVNDNMALSASELKKKEPEKKDAASTAPPTPNAGQRDVPPPQPPKANADEQPKPPAPKPDAPPPPPPPAKVDNQPKPETPPAVVKEPEKK